LELNFSVAGRSRYYSHVVRAFDPFDPARGNEIGVTNRISRSQSPRTPASYRPRVLAALMAAAGAGWTTIMEEHDATHDGLI
jgi:hypothetical protein